MKPKNFFVVLLSMVVFFAIGFSIVAHADDHNENYNERERDDDHEIVAPVVVESQPVVSTPEPQPAEVATPKMVKQTIVDPPTTVTTYEVRTINLLDSDRDGLTDDQDPHPDTPEFYFVKDDNFNGIVDTFEQE
ncbi:MAG: hypothetical protein PHW24_03425 [Candidatus Moranbacteria bacterium]|nr:hypothetical protein [Candidatus Moranbacteria bacterium]